MYNSLFFREIMPKYTTVKENHAFIFQVDGDLSNNTINTIKAAAFSTKTYTLENLAGVKDLTASFIAKTDLEKMKIDTTATVKYPVKMDNGGSMEIGVRCDLSKGEVVIPLMLRSKEGFTVGIEVKATMNLAELGENVRV